MKNKNRTYTFSLVFLSFLLISCDGGLFGTGSGTDVIVPTDPISMGGENNMDNVEGSPVASPDVSSNAQSFNNLDAGTSQTTPLLNVINMSTLEIVVSSGSNTNPLFPAPIASNSASEVAPLQLGENVITVRAEDSANALFSLNPLNAGTSSLTTLLIRHSNAQAIDVLTLRSRSLSLTQSLAQIRIVQADALDALDNSATFTLQPAGNQPGSSAIDFTGISYSASNVENYVSAGPGEYEIVDSLNRISPTPITLAEGKIYTLIIRNSTDSPVFIHEDDLLAN